MKYRLTSSGTSIVKHMSFFICIIVMVFSGLIPIQEVHAASTWYVSTSGTDNGSCGSELTPCETIAQAVSNAASGDTILVGAGIFFPPTDTPITINKNLTIRGQGAADTMVYRSGTARSVFDISGADVLLTLDNLTIWNGSGTQGGGAKVSNGASLTLNGVTLKDNRAASGAGVYLEGTGNLTVSNSTFTNNIATENGGGIYKAGTGTLNVTSSTFGGSSNIRNQAVNGAAIYLADGAATVSGGSFSFNTASGSGGAFYLANGTLQTSSGVLISSNSATVNGGGIYQAGGTLTLTETTLSNNAAVLGAGVYQQAGTLVTNSSTFNANTASTSGAGLYLASASGTNTLGNTTISGNTANGSGTSDGGGAIYKAGASTLNLDSLTIAYNISARNVNSGLRVVSGSGAITAKNSLFYKNGAGLTHANCSGVINATGDTNLDSGTTCGLSDGRSNKDPQLISLANNGGLTLTHALPFLTGTNPAINTGSTDLTTDQRGKTRATGEHPDVGAFEFQQPTISMNTATELTYTELDAATQIAPIATYADDVSTYASGDQLTVSLSEPYQIGDVLGIKTTTKIQVIANSGSYYILYDGSTNIGTVTGGKHQAIPDSSPLVISFNSNASRTAIEYLIRAVSFENTQINPATTNRTASFSILHDGVNGTGSRDITVLNPNLLPVAKSISATISENESLTDTSFSDANHFEDPDQHGLYGVVITQLPIHGTLMVNGVSAILDTMVEIGSGIIYTPTNNYFGVDSFRWKAVDNGNESIPGSDKKVSTLAATYSINVVAINDAPTTNNQTSKTLAGVAEDTLDPDGNTVSALITSETSAYYDADGDVFAGVAVVANASTAVQGFWQFSTNSGSTWTNLPVGVGNTQALVLESEALLRFLPAANWNGAPGNLTLRVWDGTTGLLSGSIATLHNISGMVGGNGSFSSNTISLLTEITPVNDDPTAVLLSSTYVAENLPVGTLVGTISATDADLVTNPGDETMIYTLGGTDAAKFSIAGNELKTTEMFNFESMPSYQIEITAIDDATKSVTTPFTITVTDDILTVSISGALNAQEKETPDNGQFTLTLEKPYPYGVVIDYELSGTADSSDYTLLDGVTPLAGTVTFLTGETEKDLTVSVSDDDIVEGDETVVLSLTTTNDVDVVIAGSPENTGTVTIRDDDTSSATIAADVATAVEGGTNGQFTVTLDKESKTDTVVTYSIGGTAINGIDYSSLGSGDPLTGTVTIPANTFSKTIDVIAATDTLVEGTQTVALILDSTDNSQISVSGSATIDITDVDSATISIAGTTAAREPATNGLFTLTMSRAAEYAVTVDISSNPASSSDYAVLPDTVTIPAGQTTATIQVMVVDDSYDEYDETLTVTLGTITGNGQLSTGTEFASILVIDDDALPRISINDVSIDPEGAAESTTTARFTVTMNRATEKTVQIDYATADDTAVSGSDYTGTNGTHTFDTVSHETSFTFDVTINGDDLVEGDETLNIELTLVNSSNGVISKGIGIATIIDDDEADVDVTASTATTTEGSGVAGQYTVTLAKASQVPVVVSYTIGGTAAAGSDYTALTGSITIPANSLSATIDLFSIQDDLVEDDESVSITLTGTDNSRVYLGTNLTAGITIEDDDLAVTSVTASPSSTTEGSATPGTFTLTLDKQSQSEITVSYSITGTATSGTDFTTLNGSVLIPALTSSVNIDVSAIDDNIVEGDETVILTLSGTDNSRISVAAQAATITFEDNDAAEFSVISTQGTAAENGTDVPTNGQFTITLSKPARVDTTIDISMSGSATDGEDYTSITSPVTFLAGETEKTIPLVVSEDELVEGDETAILTISNPQATGGLSNILFSISENAYDATVTISDDDSASLTILATSSPAIEGTANGEFTITASKASQDDVSVEYTITGTAANEADYSVLSGTITIPATQTSISIPVTVVNDDLVEGTETVILTLSAPTSGLVQIDTGSSGTATLDIQDNDQALIYIEKLADTAENGTAESFRIWVDKPSQEDLPVTFSLGGTADSSGTYQDYNLSSADAVLSGTTLTLPGGASSVHLTVTPVNDTLVEGSESLIVNLEGPTTGLVIVTSVETDKTATMTIADDDTATLTISASGSPAEGGANGTFTISTSKISQTSTTIEYSITGTAANGSDYTSAGAALSGTVIIPAFTTSVDLPITIVNDLIVEDTETIALTLTSPDSGLVQIDTGTGNSANLSITDNDTATISVLTSANAAEGGATGSFVVSVSKASQAAVAVGISIGGTALNPSDYNLSSPNAQSLTSSVVTLAPGALSAEIQVTPIDDNLVEGSENLVIILTSPQTGSVTVGTPNTATMVLADNDTAIIEVANNSNAAEGGDNGQFEITTSKPSASDTTVTFIISGSADKDGDHQDFNLNSTNETLTATTIIIPAGETSTSIDLSAVNDSVVETTEDVILTLSGSSNELAPVSTGENGAATVLITDNDSGTISINASVTSILESDAGLQYTVTTTAASQQPIEVTYTLTGNAQNVEDYNLSTLMSGSVTIPAYATQATIDLTPVQDTLVEGNESVVLTLSATNNTDLSIATDGTQSSAITINDDDSAEFSILATPGNAAENGEGTTTDGQFTITLSKAARADVTIDVAVTGSASNGTDYTSIISSITFLAGETTKTIPLAVIEDALVEGDETAILTISNPQPADGLDSGLFSISEAANSATVTISDDDTAIASIAWSRDAAEPDSDGQFSVSVDKASQVAVTLTYEVGGSSTATDGSDYTTLSGEVIIHAGEFNSTIDLDVKDDSIAENDESVTLNLTGTSSSRVSLHTTNNTATVTITSDDNDPTISIDDVTVTEGNTGTTTASFTVTLSHLSEKGVTVEYSTADDTAIAGSDYTSGSGTLTFSSTELTQTVSVLVAGDFLVEDTESFNLNLTNPANATFLKQTGTGNITNDDSASVSIANTQNGAEPATNGLFTLTLSNPVQVDTSINYAVNGNATPGADYSALTGTVTIPAGQTSQTISVAVINDAIAEFSETVQLTLTAASGIVTLDATPENQVAILNIADNDTDPTISINDVSVTETDSGTTTASFTVTLSHLSEKGVTVQYRTTNGTAIAPDDFTAATGTLSFNGTDLTKNIAVLVAGDVLVEENESYNVVLENPTHAALNKGVGAGTILENDSATVRVETTDHAAEENLVAGQFTLTLTQMVDTDVTIAYSVGGSASAASDYTDLSGWVTIPANTLTTTIAVTPSEDDLIEETETVSVTLLSVDNSRVSIDTAPENQAASVDIVDNDSAVVSVSASPSSTTEGSSTPATFTMTLDKQAQSAVAVSYLISGTATQSADYTSLSSFVIIPALTSSVNIDLSAIDDLIVEGNETVILTLTETNNPNVSVSAQPATITFTDNDMAEFSILATTSTAEENGAGTTTDGEFIITLSKAAQADVTIDVTVTGSASNGTDYTSIASSITFLAGETTKTIPLIVIEDTLVEGTETAVLSISNPQAAGELDSALFSISEDANAAIVTITDDDTAIASIAWVSDGAEQGINGQFTVNVDKVSQSAVTLTYEVDGASTATPDEDYTALTGSVTILAGANSASITVNVLDDTIAENNEIVTLNLIGTSSSLVTIDPSTDTASATITSDDADPVISLAAPIGILTEGDSGTTTATFTVTMNRDSQKGVSAVYTTLDGTALQPSDYTTSAGILNLGNGVTSTTIDVSILGDTLVEGNETFNLTLSEANNATFFNEESSLSANATVTDDDTALLSIANTQNGAEPTTNGQFTLTLSDVVQVDTTIEYNVTGTASAGTDYTALSGTITIPALSTSVSITVPVLDDTISENSETVTVTLTSASTSAGTVIINDEMDEASVSIADNEEIPQISIQNVTRDEGAGTFTFNVTLNRLSEKGVTVQYMTASGSATDDLDFTPVSGTLSFGNTQTSLPITVAINDDTIIEGDETFTLVLTAPVNAALLSASAIGTIQDNDFAIVSVATTIQAAEDTTDGQFTVTTASIIEQNMQVLYTVDLNSTATSAVDYQALSGTVTILAGQPSALIDVEVLSDSLVEGDETIQLTLTEVNNSLSRISSVPEEQTAQMLITDNDEGLISVSATTAAAAEPTTPGVFTIQLDNPTQAPLEVTYQITGTASAGVDYTMLTGSATIPAMESSIELNVSVIDDELLENPETVILTLTGPNNTLFSVDTSEGKNTATVTIHDDDSAVASIAKSSDAAEPISDGQFTVSLDKVSYEDLTLTYEVDGSSTATAGSDYTTLSGSVVIPAGDLSASITVEVTNDDIAENTETVILNLTGASSSQVSLHPTNNTAEVIITSDDADPTISIDDVVVTEGDSGTTNASFTITLSHLSEKGVTVQYRTTDNTAVSSNDYTSVSGTLTFTSAELTKSLTVLVIGDQLVEGAESFNLVLESPAHATFSKGTGIGTITDDDTASISIASTQNGSEPATNGQFDLTLTNRVQVETTIAYSVAGTASGGMDYTALSGTATIPAQALSATISVPVLDDSIAENSETVLVTLTDVSGPVSLDITPENLTASVTITDDEDDPSISIDDVYVTETDSGTIAANFTVTLSHLSEKGVSVQYFTTNATAIAPDDFSATNGTLSFSGTELTKNIAIQVAGDVLVEENESYNVVLENPINSTISDGDGVGSILENDSAVVHITNTNNAAEQDLSEGEFTLTLTQPVDSALTVTYTVAGSATAGSDYTALSGTATIPANTLSSTIAVMPFEDDLVEGTETIGVTLTSVNNTRVSIDTTPENQSASVDIVDNDSAVVSVSASPATTAEGSSTPVTFIFTLDKQAQSDVTLSYSVSGSATPAADYSSLSGSIVIPALTSSDSIDVSAIDDVIVEGDETVILTLTGTDNSAVTVASDAGLSATVTFSDNDAAEFSVTASIDTASENGEGSPTHGEFTITMSKAARVDVTIDVAVSGSAANGTDYTTIGSSLTFLAGETSKTISVAVIEDTLVEDDETATLTISNPQPADGLDSGLFSISGTASSATVTIIDDDPDPTTSINDPEVTEGDTGVNTLTFVITLSHASTKTGTVDYTLEGDSATSDVDFVFKSGTLTFEPGETSKSIDVSVIGDLIQESAETFHLSLSNGINITIQDNLGIGTIRDNDTAELSIADVSIAEGNDGNTEFTFTVTMNPPSIGTVTVDFSTENNTALAGEDYTATTGTLTFNPMETTQTITVLISGDTVYENDESFLVNLSNSENAVISTTANQGTGTIQNDDVIPVLSIGSVSQNEGNSGTSNLAFAITMDHASAFTTTVEYATENGTATTEGDYLATSGTVTFNPGDTSKTIQVSINGDRLVESNETFMVNLSNMSDNATISPTADQGTGTIVNDDHAPTLLSNVTQVVDEDNILAFTHSDFTDAFTDADNDALVSVTITSLPTHGVLKINTTAITLNQVILAANLSSLTYTPASQYFGSDAFTWTASDGVNMAIAASQVSITVTSVNDAPTLDEIADVEILRNTASLEITLTGISAGGDGEIADLTVIAASNNTAVLPNPAASYQSGIWKLTLRPTVVSGTATVTVTVNDNATSNNLVTRTFIVTVKDPSIVITPLNGLTTNEDGGTAVFSVRLGVRPNSTVSIVLSSSNEDEGTTDKTTLVFTPDNWNTPQEVTITGLDDDQIDGTIEYQIILNLSGSSDTEYRTMNPLSIRVINQDNEVENNNWRVFLPLLVK